MIKVYTDCRQQFIDAAIKVFGIDSSFFDQIDDEEYSDKYDVFNPSDGECYIINRETGEYINWYKFTHLGRDIHSTCPPERFEKFLREFKGDNK